MTTGASASWTIAQVNPCTPWSPTWMLSPALPWTPMASSSCQGAMTAPCACGAWTTRRACRRSRPTARSTRRPSTPWPATPARPSLPAPAPTPWPRSSYDAHWPRPGCCAGWRGAGGGAQVRGWGPLRSGRGGRNPTPARTWPGHLAGTACLARVPGAGTAEVTPPWARALEAALQCRPRLPRLLQVTPPRAEAQRPAWSPVVLTALSPGAPPLGSPAPHPSLGWPLKDGRWGLPPCPTPTAFLKAA